MNIVTPSLEVGTIDITPVSLESALVLQYAHKYDGLLETIATKSIDDIKKDDYLKLFQSIKSSAEWTKDKYELSQGMINTEDKKELVKSYYDFITKTNDQNKPPEWLESIVSLTFDGMGSYEKYKKFKETCKISGALKDNLKLLARYETFKNNSSGISLWITKHKVQNALIKEAFDHMDETPKCLAKFMNETAELVDLSEFKGAKAIQRLLKSPPKIFTFGTIVSLAFDSASIISEAGDFANASKNVTVRRSDFEKLLKEYIEDFGNGGSQNAIVILETYRKAVNLARAGKTKEFFELVEVTVNLALSLVALFPPTALVGELILLAKTLAELGRDASTAIIKALDYSVFKNYLLLKQSKLQEFFEARDDSHYNTSELNQVFKDKKVNDAHIQFRLRAEAIAGLYELIQWAGYRYDETKIAEFIQRYKIREYIETFILCKNSPWVFPKSQTFPLTLCEYWLFRHSTRAKVAAAAGAVAITAIAPELVGLAMAMGISSVIDNSVHKADFQKLFPIHFVENGISKDKLSKLFQTHSLDYSNLPYDIVDKILVYYRHKKEDKWTPIWSYNQNRVQITPVNPLVQIRVCVILKDDNYIFKSVNKGNKKIANQSIPLELNLLDDKPILTKEQGPVYKKNSYVLMKDESVGLIDIDIEKDYFDKKRHGVVFYPFYEYDGAQVNGLKPFTSSPSYLEFTETHQIILCLQVPRSRVKQYFTVPEKNGVKSPERLEIPLKYDIKVSGSNDRSKADLQWKMAKDEGFLKHTEATGTPVPPLARNKTKIPGIFLKRNGMFTYCKNDKKKVLTPGIDYDFDWNNPFEMVVLLAINVDVDDVCANSNAVDFRRYPLSITLFQEVESIRDRVVNYLDIQGPAYSSYFHYLGSVNVESGHTGKPYGLYNENNLKYMAQYDKIDSKEVRDISKYLLSLTAKGKSEVDKIFPSYYGLDGFAPGTQGVYALYAAHFRFSYDIELPDHQKKTFNAFRPFGKLFNHEQYYYFKITQAGVNATSDILLKTPDLLTAPISARVMSKLNDESFMIKEPQGQIIPSLRSTMIGS
jgi:hypothetical protein